MVDISPEEQCRFATEVVRRLRLAGFEAYWAGGCVRDRLMGRTPKDYDVATSARPEQVRQLFGPRRTLAVGAAFGVVNVRGPRRAGQVEVATFRQDAIYSDGRHPDHVTFSSPAADAARRDFTINGLFYDPLEDRVIDYVGGQQDLANRLIRAIGDPYQRFAEDKLRLLRAIRFAATFEFALEPTTFEAICHMAPQILVVSAERIAAEMERMLLDVHRSRAVRLLVEAGLAKAILPEIVSPEAGQTDRIEPALALLDHLRQPSFPLALAALLHRFVDAPGAAAVCRRWRLSNHQTERTAWLVAHHDALRQARDAPWSRLQPLLVAEGITELLAMEEAACEAGWGDAANLAYCRALLQQPQEVLNPPPLLTGDELLRMGIPPGPQYRVLLCRVREAQLDGQLRTQAEAIEFVQRLRNKDDQAAQDDRSGPSH